MILHEFTYDWDGKSHLNEKPVAWWPGSYRVRIVKLGSDSDDIKFLKPLAVIIKNNHSGTSLKNYIQNFALKISAKYGIDIERAYWVEVDGDVRIALFSDKQMLKDGPLYITEWRSARPNELEMLNPWLVDFK